MLKKTGTKSQKTAYTSTRSKKKLGTLVKSRPSSPKKQGGSIGKLRVPRTCEDSPLDPKYLPKARLASCEIPQTTQKIIVKEIIKVTYSKVKNRVKQNEAYSNSKDLAHLLISPIQRVPCAFVNTEDNSLIRALETLR